MLGSIKTLLCAVAVVAFANTAVASPFTYQGSLMDGGVPANGTYDMTFQLTGSAVGGFALDTDTINNVAVVDGIFTVEIDFDEALMNHDDRWIAIVIEGTPLSPRVRMRSTPRAYNAVRANTAGAIEVPLFVSASAINPIIDADATSSTGVAIRGTHTNNAGTAAGVYGRSSSTAISAVGVLGEITSTTPGIFSAGLRGINNGTSSAGIGIYGSHAGFGWGVYGFAPSGRGVFGLSTTGTGVIGSSTTGTGVTGTQGDSGTIGSLGTEDYGVEAYNTTGFVAIYGEGRTIGVRGVAEPLNGFAGVEGIAGGFNSTSTAMGVRGLATVGVDAEFRSAYGVYGMAENFHDKSTSYGVYGEVEQFGFGVRYAGYFDGDVHVEGTLSKLSGSFKIDHPMDPENKYLSHSFMESPEMMNVYSGVVVLDDQGQGTVDLPDYFETLNRDFRYQLTAIGGAMPGLHVASEIQKNSFAIAGGMAGLKVSWEVSGVRQDPSALYRPIVVEEGKAEHHRGLYLDPEAYGFGDERAIHPSPSLEEN